ncbi:MAG: hypothetical protein ACFCVE_11550 [Phycisphaerae bacterium]
MIRSAQQLALLAAATLAGSATFASAGMTSVGDIPQNEAARAGIFAQLFGGEFVQNDIGFTNGEVSLRRVLDTASGFTASSIDLPLQTDELFAPGFYDVKAVGRYSLNEQNFGYFNDDGFQSLFTVEGFGAEVTGEARGVDLTAGPFAWGRDGGQGGLHSSIIADNFDKRDHMLTYEVLDPQNATAQRSYLLFWEDLTNDGTLTPGRSNNDFNDLVVQASLLSTDVAVIPLPPAAAAGLLLLAPVLMRITKKSNRKVTQS